MSSLNGRQVTNVRCHSVTYVPTVGQLNITLSESDLEKGGYTMTKEPDGVLLKGRKGNWEAFVPNGNIISMTFAPLERSQAV